MSIDEFILELRFFVPSRELAANILELNERYLNLGKRERFYDKLAARWGRGKRIMEAQRTIGERLYRYLATTARWRVRAERDEPIRIWESIPQGMAVNLGFPSYGDIDDQTDLGRRTYDALRDLTKEFHDWILAQPVRGYQAPWGELWMIDYDHMKLSAYGRHDLRRQPLCEPLVVGASVGDLSPTRI